MQYEHMTEIDLKLSLLSGSSINIKNLKIEPYTLREIKDFGYSYYMKNLQWATLSVDDFIDSVLDEDKKSFLEEQKNKLKPFDFYVKLGGKDFLDNLLNFLKMVLKTDDILILDDGVIAVDFTNDGIISIDDNGNVKVDEEKLQSLSEDEIKVVHRGNFDDIVNIIKLQNYLEKPQGQKEEDVNPADEETRKLIEHMKKMREKVEEKKRKQKSNDKESDIDISDIISAVSSKSNSMNKLNIWDFTLYQVYDEYARLELIDNYDFSIQAMMAGAGKVDFKHWSSKL